MVIVSGFIYGQVTDFTSYVEIPKNGVVLLDAVIPAGNNFETDIAVRGDEFAIT